MDEKRSKTTTPALTVALLTVFLTVLLAGLAVRFWASDREYGFAGPTHITAGAAGVYVHASGDIIHLSPEGVLLGVFGTGRTLLADDPIDLRLLGDGSLLLAEQRPARIRMCNASTWMCRPLGAGALERIERQFKVLPLGGSAWLISDARGDALFRLDEPSGGLSEAVPAGTLAGPNGVALDAAGNPWVADTDHRRIVELLPLGNGAFVTGREHSAMNPLTIGERHFPMMIERGPGGRWWVAQAAEFSQAHSDLVVYDPDEGAVAVVSLPEGAYATDVAVLDDMVLVTDLENFVIYRVDARSLAVSEFGDNALADQLAGYREQRATWRRLGHAALALTIVAAMLMVVAAIRVTPMERRWSQPPPALDLAGAAEAVPPTDGVRWLRRNPRLRWMTRWFEKSYYVLFGLLCIVSGLIYAWSCRQPWPVTEGSLSGNDRLGLLLLAACLATASFIPIIHFAAAAFRRRVGTDGRRIHLELENGRRMAVEPDRVAWNKRALLYRQYTFPLLAGRKKLIYAEGEVQTWLAPLLREATTLTEWQTIRHQFKNRDLLILATVGAIVLMGLVLALSQFGFGR